MNRPGLTRDHIIWIKTGLPQKEKTPHGANQIKIKCCVRQIRLGRVRALLFSFQGPPPQHPPVSTLLPPTQLNLLPLLLMRLIIIRSTAVLSYHLRLLSSLIRVTVGGPTSSFVQGHIAGSFWTGLPPGGDPFVHHGVTHTEDEHELGLSPSLFSLLPFSLPSRSFLCSSLTIPFLLVHPQALPWGVKPDDETELQQMDEVIFGWNRSIHPLMSVN